MSFLRRLESSIADLVEGTFSRVFKSEVRPVEIARKLAREMENALAGEFSGYLLEYARRERLALMSRPIIHFETDDRLRLGEFGIQTSLVEHPGEVAERPRAPRPPTAAPRSATA